jgi:hypothetical protein
MRLNVDWLKELLDEHVPPCISIYLPVYRANPLAGENPQRYHRQLNQVRESLAKEFSKRDIGDLMEKLESVPADPSFWKADRDAFAVFASRDVLQVIDIHRPVDPAVFVADNFHVKPLIRVLESDWNYHVLTFAQHHVGMFLGSGESRLVPLDAQNLPQSPEVVSKMRMSHKVTATDDLHTPDTQSPGEGTAPAPVALETFMRAVDKAVWENYSRDAKLPLILCAVEEFQTPFHAISKNIYLLEEGIKHDPQHLDVSRIHQEAWAIMQPRFEAQVQKLTDQFKAAKAHEKGSDELVPVAEAVTFGRVGTLLVDGTRQIPGRLDPTSGRIAPADIKDPHADDLLDELAEMVLKRDGEVMVLPHEMMPTDTGLAAIYRY